MRTTFIALVIAALGIAAAQVLPASASPNAKECPAGVTLTASASGRTVTVGVSPAVNLKPAKDAVADSFHLHYFVDTDPATVLQPGQQVPSGNPQIIHSAATTQEFKDLAPGTHHVWVVLGDVGHVPCAPLVKADVGLTVVAASSVPATGTGDGAQHDADANWTPWAVLAAGLIAAGTGLALGQRTKRAQ